MADVKGFGELQSYLTARPLTLSRSAKDLWRQLRAALIKASNAKKIKTSPGEIERHVLLLAEPPPQVLDQLRERDLHKGAFCIVGGEKNQNRDPALPHLTRADGAWFDFSITVQERADKLELLAYDFEIRLLPGMGAPFLRFDLNLPGHHNEERELRCHLHPGADDIIVPAPLMSPGEILALFIDGARRLPAEPRERKPRSPTSFEVSWMKQTLEACLSSNSKA